MQADRQAAHLEQVESESEVLRQAKFAAEAELKELKEVFSKLETTASVLKVCTL